eukprot:9503627-Prorocentrum_lima.AAC.1
MGARHQSKYAQGPRNNANARSLLHKYCTRAPEAGSQSSDNTGRTCKLIAGVCPQAGTWNEA